MLLVENMIMNKSSKRCKLMCLLVHAFLLFYTVAKHSS